MPISGDITPAIERVLSVTRAYWEINEEAVASRPRLPAVGQHQAKPLATIAMHIHAAVGGASPVGQVPASA